MTQNLYEPCITKMPYFNGITKLLLCLHDIFIIYIVYYLSILTKFVQNY